MKDLLSDIDWGDVWWAILQTLFFGFIVVLGVTGIGCLVVGAFQTPFLGGFVVGVITTLILIISTFLFYRKENPPRKKDRW